MGMLVVDEVVKHLTCKEGTLGEVHEQHLGMFRIKALAWTYVWWTGIDQDIKATV